MAASYVRRGGTYVLYLEGDTSSMTFWRAMCDASDKRLANYFHTMVQMEDADIASSAREGGLNLLQRRVKLTAYCRRRYWQAFYQREGIARSQAGEETEDIGRMRRELRP